MNIKSRRRIGYLFLIPSLVIIAVFIAYPVINTFIRSFQELRIQTIQQGGTFVGFDNYVKAFQDSLTIQSIQFT